MMINRERTHRSQKTQAQCFLRPLRSFAAINNETRYSIFLLLFLLVPLLVWLRYFMLRKRSMQFSSGAV